MRLDQAHCTCRAPAVSGVATPPAVAPRSGPPSRRRGGRRASGGLQRAAARRCGASAARRCAPAAHTVSKRRCTLSGARRAPGAPARGPARAPGASSRRVPPISRAIRVHTDALSPQSQRLRPPLVRCVLPPQDAAQEQPLPRRHAVQAHRQMAGADQRGCGAAAAAAARAGGQRRRRCVVRSWRRRRAFHACASPQRLTPRVRAGGKTTSLGCASCAAAGRRARRNSPGRS